MAPRDFIYATPGHAFAVEDRALAQSHGRVWLSDARVARQVVDAIRTGESRKLYELHAWVVMPNHCAHVDTAARAVAKNKRIGSKGEPPGKRICCWSERANRSGSMSPGITG